MLISKSFFNQISEIKFKCNQMTFQRQSLSQ